jgi:hypothetical protein
MVSYTGRSIRDHLIESQEDRRFRDEEPRPEFVRDFWSAAQRHEDRLDLGEVVRNPWQDDPAFVNDWLFGPHGEFTTFAKPAVLNKELQFTARLHPQDASFSWTPKNRYLAGIRFQVAVLMRPDNFSLYGYQRHAKFLLDRDVGAVTYVRFSSYRDYVRWSECAQCDNTEVGNLR